MPRLNSHFMRIKLANSGEGDSVPTIRPGTVVYGEVEYQPRGTERLSALTVNMLGKEVVKGPKGRREVTQIFSVQHAILRKGEEAIPLEPKLYTFPFHFVVPWTSEYDRRGSFKDDPKGLFVDTPHRVPPTIGLKNKGDAQISYSFYAVGRKKGIQTDNAGSYMDFPSGEELENIRCIVEVPEVQAGPPSVAQVKLVAPVRKLAGSLFRRSSVSSAPDSALLGGCEVSIEAPSTAVIGESFTVATTLHCNDPGTMQAKGQSWTVSVKSVDLVAKTYRRFRDDAEDFVEVEVMPLSVMQKPVPLQPGLCHKKEVSTEILRDLATSFKGYTISRAYKLRVTLISSLDNGSVKSLAQDTECIEVSINVIRRGDSIVRMESRSHVQDLNGRSIEPPPYEDSPIYQA